jgi:hypothetical protein
MTPELPPNCYPFTVPLITEFTSHLQGSTIAGEGVSEKAAYPTMGVATVRQTMLTNDITN